MMQKRIFKSIFVIVCIISIPASLLSQEGTGRGRIKGVVTDEAGNPIEGVKIVATFTSGYAFKAKTDKKGKWAIAGMGTGLFRIMATKDGYQSVYIDKHVSQFKNDPVYFTMKKIAPQPEGMPKIDDVESLDAFEEGTKLYEQEQYQEALVVFEEFLSKNPTVHQVRINIANCYRELGLYTEALAEYQKLLNAIKEEKGSLKGEKLAASILADIGSIYVCQGDLEKAGQYFQQSIDIDPNDERLAFNVAGICFKQGESDKAITYYKHAIEIRETWPRPYRQLGYAYLNKGKYKLALETFEKFLELDPENPQAQAIRDLIPSIKKLIKN